MKAMTLSGKETVTLSQNLNGQAGWILLIKRVMRFFHDACESDWEKKTGLSLRVSFFL